jgi:hypothetical protein
MGTVRFCQHSVITTKEIKKVDKIVPSDCYKSPSLRGASATKQSRSVAITGLLRSARNDNSHKHKFCNSLPSLNDTLPTVTKCPNLRPSRVPQDNSQEY